jgi:hypothetical protein
MIIGIIGSMHFSEKMIEVAEELKRGGHTPLLSNFVHEFPGKDDEEKERTKLRQKFESDAMRRDWTTMSSADALLVINLRRHGIDNYIGGNTLFELAAGYFSGKRIYLLNPVPDIGYYDTELKAIDPIILDGDISKI